MVPAKEERVAALARTELTKQFAELRRLNIQEVGVDVRLMSSTEALGTEDLAGARGELTEVPRAQGREHDADRPGLPTRESGGQVRRREIEPIGGLDDALWLMPTPAMPRSARDTVPLLTPASRATSAIGASSGRLRPRRDHPGVSFSEHDFNYTAGGASSIRSSCL